jgi:hypothetical protein
LNKHKVFLILLFLFPLSLFATERLEWSEDENVFEYKVEVKNKATGEIKSYTTQENFIDISESSGEYEFRVKTVDMLGREGNATAWQGFRISKAMTPVLAAMPPAVWQLPEAGGEAAVIPVDIQNVSGRTKVQLVNQETQKVVEGRLVIKNTGGILAATGIKVPELESGEWKIKVTDPSGRSAETGVIKIENQLEERRKKEAIAKAEAEEAARKAELEAAREAELAAAREAELEAAKEAEALAMEEEAAGEEKIFASSGQKLRIEKQIAKRVRGFQKSMQ